MGRRTVATIAGNALRQSPIEEGHISCALIHLANVSYRLGRAIHFRPETQEINGDEEAMRLMREADRGYRDPYVVPEKV